MLNEKIMQKYSSNVGASFISENEKTNQKKKKSGSNIKDFIELKRKVSESMDTKNELIQKENSLKSQIDNMNADAELTMKILEEKKEQLMIENDNLTKEYELYPSVEFLEEQLIAISRILDKPSVRKKPRNIKPDSSVESRLRKMKILDRDEDCSILQVRLEDLVDQAKRTFDPGPPQPLIHKGTPEEIEYRKNIQLFKVADESATLRIKYEIEKTKMDIQKIKDEVDEYYRKLLENEYESSQNSEDIEESVRQILIAAGGNINFFKKVEDDDEAYMFEYENKKIFVFKRYGEFYGECDNAEFPLMTLFKTLVTFSHSI